MRGRRVSSRFRWICATAAPWALGTGLLVSFTATAGQNVDIAWSTAPLTRLVEQDVRPGESGFIQHASVGHAALVKLVHLGPNPIDSFRQIDPAIVEHPPRAQAKAKRPTLPPEINRAAKRDPILTLKPSFGRTPGGEQLAGLRDPYSRLIFRADPGLTASLFVPGLEGAEWDQNRFEPRDPAMDGTTSRVPGGSASPLAGGGGGTSTARIISVDGATPATPKAVALSSTTPAPADATPVEIAAAPVSLPPGGLPTVASIRRGGQDRTMNAEKAPPPADVARPSYASLIDPQAMSREQRCLAEAVYFEARSESEEGQAAVAQVVLNRVKSGLYPSSVCGVVYQNRHRYMACQFSFACEGKSLRITEPAPWAQAVRVAREVTEGKTYLTEVGGATHYHADYVQPYWAKRLKKMDVIGRHVFYKLRPGQT